MTVKLGIYIDKSLEFQLLAGPDSGGRVSKWYPKMGKPFLGGIPEYVVETMDILVDGSSDDWLAEHFKTINRECRARALRYFTNPGSIRGAMWLYTQMEEESGGDRRALIRSINGTWLSSPVDEAGQAKEHNAKIRLDIERHPCWECPDEYELSGKSPVAGAVVRFDYDTTLFGDVGGRIKRLGFYSVLGDDIDRVWIGFRSRQQHELDARDWGSIWEMEDGTAGTDCTLPVSDSTASGGEKAVVDFATQAGWAKRHKMYLAQSNTTAADADEMTGVGLWLLRCKVTGTAECEVQLRYGWPYLPDDQFIPGPVLKVNQTGWDYVEMGSCQIPIGQMKDSEGFAEQVGINVGVFTVQIWARRTSGSGNLELDCHGVIPVDEGWLVAKGIGELNDDRIFWYFHSPEERGYAVTLSDTNLPERFPSEWAAGEFYVPAAPFSGWGQMCLYVAFARASTSDITDQIGIHEFDYYPRFLDLRGNA